MTVLLIVAAELTAETNFHFDRTLLGRIEAKYGSEARVRILAWEELIRRGTRENSDLKKLEMANRFFNERIIYGEDIDIWGLDDYWATPVEFLSKGAGDCEDYAIAKYFTLKAMGMSEQKLNITYVKAIRYNMAHMVLTYYSTPSAEPLVMDNLVDEILTGSKRADLVPVFSFNASGLWLASQRGRGRSAGSVSKLGGWTDMQRRMSQNKF
jgi:predicted transglutaminase-like cysteine proteinase